jgi:hypothetical protein
MWRLDVSDVRRALIREFPYGVFFTTGAPITRQFLEAMNRRWF